MIEQYVNRVLKCLSINGEFHIPASRFSIIKDLLLNGKVVLEGQKKFIATKFKNLGFEIEKNEEFVIIKGSFKKDFYKFIL